MTNRTSRLLRLIAGCVAVCFGGTLRGQTIISGTYDGITISGDIATAASTVAIFTGGSTFTGTNATLGNSSVLYWQQVGALTGKAVSIGSGALVYVNGNNNALTLGPGTTVTGDASIYSSGSTGTSITNQGTITHTTGSGSIYAPTFTNSGAISATSGTLYLGHSSAYSATNTGTGTVTANGSGTTVYIRGDFSNNGVLTAQNSGILLFDGTNTTGNLGNVQLASGGKARLNGTLTNTALAAPTGGSFELFGGTITGGTIAAGALSFTSSGGYLDGATLSDNLNLAASTYVRFTGGGSFTGAIAALANNAGLYWEQTGTITGKAVTLGTGAYIYLNGTNHALTLAANSSVTGDLSIYSSGSSGTAFTNLGTLTHTGGSSSIYAPTFTNSGAISATAGTLYLGHPSAYTATNSATGTVTANGSGTTVYIRGNFSNNGVLTAQNSGVLYFDGTNTTGNLGNVQLASGGKARLNGTLTNTALAAPTGGAFELYGGTITGGTVAAGALSFTSSGGYLDGATLSDNLNLAASTYVRFTGGASFTGATATLANSAGLYWEQTGTLSGKAITLGTGAYLYLNGTNNTLTLAANSSVTGDLSIYSSGSTGTAFTNQGTLTHTGGSSSIYAPTFTNSGTITATAGTLYLGHPSAYSATNTGTGAVTADGSGTTVYLRGNFSNNGVLTAQNSGVLYFDGTNTTGNLGNVQLATGGHARLNGTLTNTALSAPTGGSFDLYGGTISGGTIAAGALSFTSVGGYLDGATLADNLTLAASTYVRFTGGASFSGSTATFGNNAGLYWEQVGTLSNKAITLGTGSYLYVNGTNNTLTLAANSSVTGDLSIYSSGSTGTAITNQGTLTHTGGSSSIYAPTFTNSGAISATAGTLYLGYPNTTYTSTNTSGGTITASGSGTTVYIRGNFSNSGVLTAQNSGVLYFDGTNTSGNLGNVQLASGGKARLDGTLTNTALAAPTGGSFDLYGGTISGGTIAAGALAFTSSGGYLSGATLSDNLTLAASTYVRFTSGASFTGATATLGNNAGLYWEQAGTLNGKAITLGTGAYLYVNGANNALTLAANSSVTGDLSIYSSGSTGTAITNQGTLTHTGGNSSIYAPTFTNSGAISATAGTLYLGYPNTTYTSTNTSGGTITASGSGTTVYIRGNFSNSGVLTAQNSGVLYFDGTNTTGNLGNVQLASGGKARLDGTFTNTTLAAPTGGSFDLYGGTISGGTIAAGALSFTSSGGYLDGAVLSDNLTLAASSHVRFTNGASFSGATASIGTNAGVYWQQVGTLSGKAITLANGSYLYVSGANNALTLGATTSVTGDASVYSDGSSGTAITNQGTITHNSSSGSLYAKNFTNTGTITASAGSLTLGTSSSGSTFANQSGASINVTGGANVFLTAPAGSPIVNQGLINVQSGILFTGGDLANGATGTIAGAGTINGNLTLSGGTLAPGNSIGTLTVTSGTLTVTSPAVFAVELGGTTADQLVFNNPPAAVNLGSGLLSLSLTLLSPPADNTTYNLVRIASGGSGITGSFANLPVSGNTINASFGGGSYTFAVNYQTNLVSLNFTAVPEPSTWILLGAGVALLVLGRRRARG